MKEKEFIHMNTKKIRERDPRKSLRTQYQVFNETKIRRNQKLNKNQNVEIEVNSFPIGKSYKKIFEKPNIDLEIPSCIKRIWIDFDQGYYCENCE